jgi:hypothetical protein
LVERKPSNAVNIINGSNVFVLGEKSGVTLDAGAAAAIRSAYGHSQTAILKTTRVNPAVTANDISGDTAQAQAIIASVVAIITPKRSDSPRPEQIASWLIFNGPGKGVSVDPAGVANYVAAIPGSFDRAAATTALAAALTAHQSTTISPSLKHVTPSPKPASLIASTPVITYTYCAVENTTIGSDLPGVIAAAIAANPGWTLGRKVAFAPTATGCNLAFQVADTGTLKSLAPACETQTSCRIHNDLAISTNAWSHVPTTWVGSQDSYHRELVNHVLGQWLGFDHPSCSVGAAAANVIATPYISITGCSAKWYQVPLETQDTKVLAGF